MENDDCEVQTQTLAELALVLHIREWDSGSWPSYDISQRIVWARVPSFNTLYLPSNLLQQQTRNLDQQRVYQMPHVNTSLFHEN